MKVGTTNIEIRCCRTIPEILQLEPIWKSLENPLDHSNYGNSFEYISSGLQSFARDSIFHLGCVKNYLVLVAYENGKPISLAPFWKVERLRRLGPVQKHITYVEFIGTTWGLDQYRDIVGRKNEEMAVAFADWLYRQEQFDVLNLMHLAPSSAFCNLDSGALSVNELAPFIDLNELRLKQDNVTFTANTMQSVRTGFNRARKRNLDLQVLWKSVGPAEFEEIIRLATCKTPAGKGTQFAYDDFAEFVRQLSGHGGMVVQFLQADGNNIAYRLRKEFALVQHCIDCSFDREYEDLNTSAIMIQANIQRAYNTNVQYVSLGMGAYLSTVRFATHLQAAYKYTRRGNTVSAPVVEKLIQTNNRGLEEYMIRRAKVLAPKLQLEGANGRALATT